MGTVDKTIIKRTGTRRVNRIKELRLARGWSLADVGRMTNQSFVTVLRQENGERGISPETIALYSSIFEVCPDELFII